MSRAERSIYQRTTFDLPRVWQRLKEAAFILLMAMSFFIFVALLTRSDADPSWSTFTTVSHFHNAGGRMGALWADLSYSAIGIFAYGIPLSLCYIAIKLLYRESDWTVSSLLWCFRSAGFLCGLVAGCALMDRYFPWKIAGLPMGNGGIFGHWLQMKTMPWLGYWGGLLLFTALWLVGITLATGLSWFGLVDRLKKPSLASLKKWYAASMRRPSRVASKRISPTLTPPAAEAVAAVVKPVKPEIPMPAETSPLPSVNLLQTPQSGAAEKAVSQEQLQSLSADIEERLLEFGIVAKVLAAYPGPVITRFELEPAAGIKVSRIVGLAKDLARALSVPSVRVLEVVPGKSVVGIEIPNPERRLVNFRSVLASADYQASSEPLTLALGQDIAGHPVMVNLPRMPHLLVAGTTGSGKSVGINTMLLSLLYKNTPEVLRLILVDPKILELSVYADIPHLLTPVITDMKEAAQALRWCVAEMDRRYQLMAQLGVRNIEGFNQKIADSHQRHEPLYAGFAQNGEPLSPLTALPYIVVIIDEFADMMMVVGKKVEELIARLAQKARASGIHLILATQRPSVDVITGLIKANIPARIAFQVSSKVDSRTILDQSGAEQLLGQGDMLYLPAGSGVPVRVHGAFVSDEEVHTVVNALKRQGPPNYALNADAGTSLGTVSDWAGELDPLYDEAVNIVLSTRRASVSHIQRRLKIGYNRAARLIETMESAGLVGALQSGGNRDILVRENE